MGPAPSYDVRVADFGTALVRDLCPSDKIGQHTAWLAPEQVQSEGSGGQETDVFAAALVAFFALTSRSYWRSCRSKSLDTVRWRSRSLPIDSAVQRAAELSVELPLGLDSVFARALARDPAQRFPTIGEFAVAFRAAVLPDEAANPLPAQAIEVEHSPPPPSESRVRPWKIASYAIVAGSVLAIAGIVWATARASKTTPRVERELADETPQPAPRVVEPPPIETAPPASMAALPAASVPAPPPSDQAPTAASAEAPAPEPPVAASATAIAPKGNVIIVTCTPPCDVIYVDGKKVPLVGQPIIVPPGKHMVTGTSGGLRPQNQLVRVKPGEPTNLDLIFPVPASSATAIPAARPAPRPAKKPCGKFLKRCD